MGAFRTAYRVADPAGKSWRDGLPVDCSGKTPNGSSFSDIKTLRQLLAKNPEQLARGVARHLVTYATGAPAGVLDRAAIEALVKTTAGDEYGMRSLIHAVVQSELFRWK